MLPALSQYFTIKMSEGVVATSYASGDKFYIDPMKLLPLERFLPKPKGAPGAAPRGGRGGKERARWMEGGWIDQLALCGAPEWQIRG